jgi:hypothetical protein
VIREASPTVARELLAERFVDDQSSRIWAQLLADLHEKQRAFVLDRSPRKCALKGRRGGGSYGTGAWLVQDWWKFPGGMSLFLAHTKEAAKNILWPTLEDLNERYGLGVTFNGLDLAATFPNGYRIVLKGAKDRAQIEKLRGFSKGCRRIAIDECFTADTPIRAIGGVVRRIARPAPTVLVTVDGVTSTPDHPYLTPDGWKRAGDLQAGDLLYVWGGFSAEPSRQTAAQDVLRELSLPLDGPEFSGERHAHTHAAEACQRFGAAGPRDSGAATGVRAEVLGDDEEDRASAERARRERPWAYVAGVPAGQCDWLETPSRGPDGRTREGRTTDPLQIGPRVPIAEAGGGGGRAQPREPVQASAGHAEGGVASWRRVGCVEVHERGGVGRYDEVCPDGLVYNVTTESGLYFAGGRLVHNCGSFEAHDDLFRYLLKSVLIPQLMDQMARGGGQLALIGSPGQSPVGHYFELTTGRDHMGKTVKAWPTHHWTALDNPHVRAREFLLEELESGAHVLDDTPPETIVEMLLQLRDVPANDNDPRWEFLNARLSTAFRREYLAQWVRDDSRLIYLAKTENLLPAGHKLPPGQYRISIGCDIGWGDGNGFAVAAKEMHGTEIFVLEAYYLPELGTADIAEELRQLAARYHTSEIYVDTGGEGQRLVVDLERHGVYAYAAGKGRKKVRIEYVRSLLERKRLKIRPDACAALLTEWTALPWSDDRQVHREGYVDDVTDAGLMAIMPLSQLFVPTPKKKPAYGSEEWRRAEDRREYEAAVRQGKRIKRREKKRAA